MRNDLISWVDTFNEQSTAHTRIQQTFDERGFYSTSRILLRCTHLGRDLLSACQRDLLLLERLLYE